MHRLEAANGYVTIIYDKDVAARTNMPRAANNEQTAQAVGAPKKGNGQN
jgi:hypothetical protein